MITYDDDQLILVFRNGESRSFRRTDGEQGLLGSFIEPMRAGEWLRRTDDAMFANYCESCIDR